MNSHSSSWSHLPPLPDPEGFAGMYAGTHGNILICAGGTNFPGRPMLEGGVKTWTDRVFTLAPESPAWREAGRTAPPLMPMEPPPAWKTACCASEDATVKATAATFTCWEFAAEP